MPKDNINNLNAIDEFINAHALDQIKFLIELCNQNSHSYNKQGVDAAADLIIRQLGGIFPYHDVKKEMDLGDHHFFKTSPEENNKAIYLIGHMDTVFPKDHPFQKCHREKDRLLGPGTADMKGGLAVFVYSLKALAEIGILSKLDLTLILNSDEEIGSEFSSKIFLAERNKAAVCLCGECAGPQGEIVVSRNGKMGARLDCWGQDRHVSEITGKKTSAILELSHKVIALESLNGFRPGLRVNVGRIEGGLGPGTVPAHASCLIDLRWREETFIKFVMDKIRKEISLTSQPGCRCEFKIVNSRPAMPERKESIQLFKILQKVAAGLGQTVNLQHRQGTSDVNFFGAGGIPSLDGFGPIGFNDHTPQEYILTTSIKDRTLLLSHFLVEIGYHLGMLS